MVTPDITKIDVAVVHLKNLPRHFLVYQVKK